VNKHALAGASVVSLVIAGITPVAAQGNPDNSSAWYVGAGAGQTFASIPDETIGGIDSLLTAANAATSSVIDKDKHSAAFKFFVGYSFNPYFALEGGFASLGDSSANMQFVNSGSQVGYFNLKYHMNAAFIDALGLFPFQGAPATFLLSNNEENESKVSAKFGAGIGYAMNAAFTARLEWERYKMPDPLSDETFDADTATLSLLYRF
jgi:opacity protein-like surface antigen